jgi:hypothetical protein
MTTIGTWLSSHDCPNLELRHHQKFAVFVIVITVFVTFWRQNYTFSFILPNISVFFLRKYVSLQRYSINMQD